MIAANHSGIASLDPKKAAASNGNKNWRMKVMTANSHDIGCSRPSGWKSSVTGCRSTEERISQSDRFCVLQTFELNLRVATASRIQLQSGNAIAALQRSLG